MSVRALTFKSEETRNCNVKENVADSKQQKSSLHHSLADYNLSIGIFDNQEGETEESSKT